MHDLPRTAFRERRVLSECPSHAMRRVRYESPASQILKIPNLFHIAEDAPLFHAQPTEIHLRPLRHGFRVHKPLHQIALPFCLPNLRLIFLWFILTGL